MARSRKIEFAYYAPSVAAIRRAAAACRSDAAAAEESEFNNLRILRFAQNDNLSHGPLRIYFGAEFCQWRLPSPKTLSNALAAADKIGSPFTLLTPWVTDAGIKKLGKLFSVLRDEAPKSEVVINDMGALVLLCDEFPELSPVLGRVLIRQRRCPRVPGIINNLPPEGREIYMRAGAEDPVSAKLLRRYKIRRMELDYPLQGLEIDLRETRLKASVYTPYAFVTLTRYCPASFDGRMWQAFSRSGCRLKGCNKNILELNGPAHPGRPASDTPLLMRGNAQFVVNPCLPAMLPDGIDRITYMENVP